MKYLKILIFIVISLLLGCVASPVFIGKSIDNNERINLTKTNQSDRYAEVILYEYCEDGTINKMSKKISIVDAISIYSNHEKSNEVSLVQLFNNLEEQEKNIHNVDVEINNHPILNSIKNTNNPQPNSIFNIVCQLNMKLLGLGFVLGTHAVVPVGGDILGLFVGVGSVDCSGGFLDDQHYSGLCIGGFVGFIGYLLLALVPFFPGPIIVAEGTAGLTIWV